MSKVTLLDYKSMIDEKIKYIRNKINTENLQLEDFGGTVFSETLVAQYKMMRDYLNRNSLNKRFFSDDLENRELLNAYYSHMYMHNHIAFEDEVFEAIDAINSLNQVNIPSDKFKLKKLLVLEELIDIYHFLLEYTCILKEHILMQVECIKFNEDAKDFTSLDLEKFLTIDDNFGLERYEDRQYNVFDFIRLEGKHIASDVFSARSSKSTPASLLDIHYMSSWLDLLRLNREFIRNCSFKDWKNYPEDFYNAVRFAILTNITRKMYYLFIQIFSYYNHYANVLYDDEPVFTSYNYNDTLQLIYGIYMAKRFENIRRQEDDPRYTGRDSGKVVGIET